MILSHRPSGRYRGLRSPTAEGSLALPRYLKIMHGKSPQRTLPGEPEVTSKMIACHFFLRVLYWGVEIDDKLVQCVAFVQAQ